MRIGRHFHARDRAAGSRPRQPDSTLVVHRMNVGDLPYRNVGAERRTTREHVLALKSKLEAQREALDALAEDTEDLIRLQNSLGQP